MANPVTLSEPRQKRTSERRTVTLSGRLLWKDGRGATRFTPVVTRNVSEHGVFVECETPASIPLYRLVQLQLERDGGDPGDLPAALRSGRVLTAVYRVGKYRSTTGTPEGYALRVLIEPSVEAAAIRSIA